MGIYFEVPYSHKMTSCVLQTRTHHTSACSYLLHALHQETTCTFYQRIHAPFCSDVSSPQTLFLPQLPQTLSCPSDQAPHGPCTTVPYALFQPQSSFQSECPQSSTFFCQLLSYSPPGRLEHS